MHPRKKKIIPPGSRCRQHPRQKSHQHSPPCSSTEARNRTVEEYPRLRVEDLHERGQWRSERGRLLRRHREEGHEYAVEWYLKPQARSVRLVYQGPSTPVESEILLRVRRQAEFGRLWYFRCPCCSRRCKVLYYVGYFACRQCHGLSYRRSDRRRVELYRQLSRNLSEYEGREVSIGMVRRLLHGQSRGNAYELTHETIEAKKP